MRLIGHLVMRNEAERYLDSCLTWFNLIVDELHVFDDGSTDASIDVAYANNARVSIRPKDSPAFLEAEHLCREMGWRAMESVCKPEECDWVLCLDADEFFVSYEDEFNTLVALTDTDADGYQFSVPEVFAVAELEGGDLVQPQVRVDGYWPQITATRFVKWRPGGRFSEAVRPGLGSVPTYVQTVVPCDSYVLHYGYAMPEDVAAKYERYREQGLHHSNRHIDSIPEPPVLRLWTGPMVNVRRGRLA